MGIFALAYENGITIGEAISVSITGFVVVLLILALLSVLVLLLSKGIRLVEGSTANRKKKTDTAAKPQEAAVSAAATDTPLPENTSAGNLETFDVDEKTAAVIMAIVSHESGIPLNRLLFKSIKRIEK